MTRAPLPNGLSESGVVAILRGGNGQHVDAVASTLVEAGITCLEITTNTAGGLAAVSRLCQRYEGAVQVGVGTVLNTDHVRQSHEVGARFVVAPNTDATVGKAAAEAGLAWFPGAFTPTEIAQAWKLGASAVKIFPAEQAGGPAYVSAVRAPLDNVLLVPTGGVHLDTAAEYIRAGAVAVGAASPLVGDALRTGDLAGLTERARHLLAAVREGRE